MMFRSALLGACAILAGQSGVSVAAPTQASPGNNATPNISVCRSLKEAASRLKCYDSLPAPGLAADGASAAVKGPSDDKVIVKWSGSSQMQTRPFRVDGPWELQWDTAAGYFSATLHRTSGPGAKLALLANGAEGGSSSSYQPTGRDFYIEFQAMQRWSARVVSVLGPEGGHAPTASEEPLLPVSGDQSDLPACDGPNGSNEIKKLVENSPFGQMMRISVLHVGRIVSKPIRDSMSVCTAPLMTNGGEMLYDFQFYRKDGEVYIFGKPNVD
jgi:hypothetical protein